MPIIFKREIKIPVYDLDGNEAAAVFARPMNTEEWFEFQIERSTARAANREDDTVSSRFVLDHGIAWVARTEGLEYEDGEDVPAKELPPEVLKDVFEAVVEHVSPVGKPKGSECTSTSHPSQTSENPQGQSATNAAT